jgi:glutamate--cysteine ligase
MGIVTVRDVADLAGLNEKLLGRMNGTKAGQQAHDILIQEGVLSNERMNDAEAEPMVYMIDRYVVGGFYRIDGSRDVDQHPDAPPPPSFVPLAFEQNAHLPPPGSKSGASVPNRFYMYGVVGRLAMLAASYELEATDPDAEVYE